MPAFARNLMNTQNTLVNQNTRLQAENDRLRDSLSSGNPFEMSRTFLNNCVLSLTNNTRNYNALNGQFRDAILPAIRSSIQEAQRISTTENE